MTYDTSETTEYRLVGPLAYQGKGGCTSVVCTRSGIHQRTDGSWDMGQCAGWHCSYCDATCSSQGHRCDASEAVLGEAMRVLAQDADQ